MEGWIGRFMKLLPLGFEEEDFLWGARCCLAVVRDNEMKQLMGIMVVITLEHLMPIKSYFQDQENFAQQVVRFGVCVLLLSPA
ncbi:hypothetical protein BTVI_21655 [Pitangus sulphuratus]|nr:hypothetical protein BTVI_21655 [Pitangus sulphuratus]